MSRKVLSVVEAKATLADVIRDVEAGGSVVITRQGKAVAALVSAEDLAAIECLRTAEREKGSGAKVRKSPKDPLWTIERLPRQSKRRVTNLG
jgi:prevent-host-death family protein